jgi:hypothetical protein
LIVTTRRQGADELEERVENVERRIGAYPGSEPAQSIATGSPDVFSAKS